MLLQKWTRPAHYFGEEWHDYYVFMSQNRDSGVLTRSNFRSALAAIGGETGFDENENGEEFALVTVVRENHSLCGWVEWIAIHESNIEAIEKAEKILERLEDYPIVDEEDMSELEWEENSEYWEKYMSVSERIHHLRTHSYTCESFADLVAAVRGSWYHAVNMLHDSSLTF